MLIYICNMMCVIQVLWEENCYYQVGCEFYVNVMEFYFNVNIWLIGYFFGGVVSFFFGFMYGVLIVIFQVVLEVLLVSRLGLFVFFGVDLEVL